MEVFEGLDKPVAIVSDGGDVLVANAMARRYLGVEPQDVSLVHLDLVARETLSSVRRGGEGGNPFEFFLADVPVRHASRESCALSVTPLESGHLRVSFIDGDPSRDETPSARVMRALGASVEHALLFDDVQELAALFGAALGDVFPDYPFVLEFICGSKEASFEFSATSRKKRRSKKEGGGEGWRQGSVTHTSYLMWTGSKAGEHRSFDAFGVHGFLHIETPRQRGFTPAEKEAFSLFAHIITHLVAQRAGARHVLDSEGMTLSPLLDHLHTAVALCDAKRMVRSCNETFARLVEVEREDLFGKEILSLFDPHDADAIRAASAAAMSGQAVEPVSARLGSAPTALSVRITPGMRGGERIQAQQRSFLLIVESDDAGVAELKGQFERANQLLQIGHLATGLAHELKTPLTSMLNYADYLLEKYRGQFFESRDSERLVAIIEGVERIDKFVRDLVLLARPDHEGASAEIIDVHRVVSRAVLLCDVSLQQHNATLAMDLGAARSDIVGHESQLVQVFVNLLSNAAAALPESGGHIEVYTRMEGDSLSCSVCDDGMGMDEETRRRIFEPFYTTHRTTGGTGLGLALVAAIVERHGGHVDVEATPKQGATFTLVFPLARAVE